MLVAGMGSPSSSQAPLMHQDLGGVVLFGAPVGFRAIGLVMVKELVPIVCAAAVWGPSWTGLHVLCYCDNMSVVHALNKGSSREPSGVVMHLLRTLTFFSAIFGFVLRAQHVAGLYNGPADAISKDNLSLFFSQVPNAAREPTPIPEELWTLLVREQPDWLSERWKNLFTSFCRRAWPVPQ